jgi:signal transduction histidine kinase
LKVRETKSLRFKLAWYALISMAVTCLTVAGVLSDIFYYRSKVPGSAIYSGAAQNMEAAKNMAAGQRGFYLFTGRTMFDIGLILIFSLLLFTILFLLISYDTIQYIKEIIIGIERMKNGDMETEIRVAGQDELAVIASSINEMRMKIASENETKRLAEQTKDELITNVAHDLRTPLTSIIGYLDLVRRENFLTPAQQKKYIGIVYDKAKSLETLIKDLFDYTRYDKDKMKIHRNRLDLNRFTEQLIDEFYPSFAEKDLICKKDLTKEELPVYGDGELLARAIGNLISNAIKYGADGKLVEIYTRREQEYAVLRIVNYGRIIPKEDLEKIFDKFYRVESSRSLKTGGTGLGLAIAKNIIGLHDGVISAQSGTDGTMFQIELPLIKEKEK